MEYLCRNLELQNNSTIIGEKDQVLQIVLKKNDSIVFNKRYLFYLSSPFLEETPFSKKKKSTDERILALGKRIEEYNLIRLRNIENNFEYVGLFNIGKIMKIYPFLYNDLFIRYDCLLAMSENLDLIYSPETKNTIEKFHFSDKIFNIGHKFYLVASEKIKEKSLENFSITDYSSIKDCLYLTNENLLIEKRLGKDEDIMLKNNSLICYERSVSFHKLSADVKYKIINKNEYFVVSGPGLIIFELSSQKTRDLKNLRNIKFIGLLSFILIILWIINYVIEEKLNGGLYSMQGRE